MPKLRVIIETFDAWRTRLTSDENSFLNLTDASTAQEIELEKKQTFKVPQMQKNKRTQ